jgi:hypothetical protein
MQNVDDEYEFCQFVLIISKTLNNKKNKKSYFIAICKKIVNSCKKV